VTLAVSSKYSAVIRVQKSATIISKPLPAQFRVINKVSAQFVPVQENYFRLCSDFVDMKIDRDYGVEVAYGLQFNSRIYPEDCERTPDTAALV